MISTAGSWRRIDAAAQRAVVPPDSRESLRLANWKPVFPLTAAILVIAARIPAGSSGRTAVAESSVPGVSVTEADQVEQTLDDIQLLRQLDSAATPNGRNSKM